MANSTTSIGGLGQYGGFGGPVGPYPWPPLPLPFPPQESPHSWYRKVIVARTEIRALLSLLPVKDRQGAPYTFTVAAADPGTCDRCFLLDRCDPSEARLLGLAGDSVLVLCKGCKVDLGMEW